MRYFIVTYYMKADGKHDEAVNVTTRLSKTVERTANVILDFKERKVIKARMEQPIERDWNIIRDYYNKIYTQIIDSLEKSYPPENDAPNEN